MGKSCSKICHFHHRSTSSTTFVIAPAADSQKKSAGVVPEIALVTTNVTEENQEEGVVIELQECDGRRDDTFKCLQSAIQQCSFPQFQSFFEAPSTDLCPEEALSLLISACANNQTDIARLVLTRVASVNQYTYPSENPLLLAIKHKNIEVVMSLIEAGAELNPRFRKEEEELMFSPVFAAVKAGDPDVLKLIIASGGDLSASLVPPTQGPSHLSVIDIADPRHEDVFEYLSRTYPIARLQVPLRQKVLFFLPSSELEAEVERLELSPDYKLTPWGMTPWLLSCKMGLKATFFRCLSNNPGVVNSADDVSSRQFGMTGLMYAAIGRREELCREIVTAKGSVGARNKWGKSAVHFAAEGGRVEIVDLMNPSSELLNQKTDVRHRQTGETVMDLISQFCSLED